MSHICFSTIKRSSFVYGMPLLLPLHLDLVLCVVLVELALLPSFVQDRHCIAEGVSPITVLGNFY